MTVVHMTSTPLSRTCGFTFFIITKIVTYYKPFFFLFCSSSPYCLTIFCATLYRNPLGIPIAKRDSLLEKCAMFREAAGALRRQPSQDNGLDSPFGSGASKLEQVPCHLTSYKNQSKTVSTQKIPKSPEGFTQDRRKKVL